MVTSANKVGTDNVKTGYEFSEVADPYFEFIRANYTVDFASIKGGSPPEDGFDEKHENSYLFKKSNGFKRLNFSHKLENVNIDAYDAIFFPGGLGPMVDMVDNELIKKVIAKMYENKKIVSAVCHGPVALLNVKLTTGKFLLEGKKVTCFTKYEEKIKGHHLHTVIPFMLEDVLKKEKAILSYNDPFENNVVVDENLITGQNPASAIGVAKSIIQKLSNN